VGFRFFEINAGSNLGAGFIVRPIRLPFHILRNVILNRLKDFLVAHYEETWRRKRRYRFFQDFDKDEPFGSREWLFIYIPPIRGGEEKESQNN
jgi:hypothetical protein